MNDVYITNVAAFLPNECVANDELEHFLGQVGGKPSRARRPVLRSNGITGRYYAIDRETGKATHTNAELTAEAVRLLEDREFSLDEMDCLSCGTSLPDQLMPNHAVMVHGELGTPPSEVVATSGVCVAGVTAMKYAYLGVSSGNFQSAVATGSELASPVLRGDRFRPEIDAKIRLLDSRPELAFEKDFLRWMLSDGAGAVLLRPAPREQGISLRIDWIFERSYANEVNTCMYSGAKKLPDGRLQGWKDLSPDDWLNESVFSIQQDVKQLNEKVIHYTLERPLQEIRRSKGINSDDVDYFLPHYSSEFFRQRVYDGLVRSGFEIPNDRWFTNLTSKGNTGSAAIYIMLDELFRSGRLRSGEKLLAYVPESGRFSTAFMLMTVIDPDNASASSL
jgi:3-oxoacyl-[acyl-carrier-protein] synthase-3